MNASGGETVGISQDGMFIAGRGSLLVSGNLELLSHLSAYVQR